MAGELSTVIEPNLMDMPQLQTQWARIRGRLQSEVGDVEYRNWLRQMTLAGIDGDEITVLLPTRFLADWVRSRYGDRLNALWQSENPAHPPDRNPRGRLASPVGAGRKSGRAFGPGSRCHEQV